MRNRSFVSCTCVDTDPLFRESLEDVIVHASCLTAHATSIHEGQVDDVGLEDHGVIEGRQNRAIDDVARVQAGAHPCNDNLRVGGHSLQVGRICSSDGSDVTTVIVDNGINHGGIGHVVEGERELLVDVFAVASVTQFLLQLIHVALAQANVNLIHRTSECRV